MFRLSRFALFVCAASLLAAAGRPPVQDPAVSKAQAALAQLPLRFESNQGQADPSVRYSARSRGYTLLLKEQGPTLAFGSSQRVDISLLGSKRAPRIEPADRQATRTDYYLGGRDNWHTKVASYSRVAYRDVYPGVDVVYYGNQNQLEYDFVLQPGADPAAIRLKFAGADKVRISAEGDLVVDADGSQILQKKPFIYQDAPGAARRKVNGRYVMVARNVVGVRLDGYDRSLPLVIDPTIEYCSYLGGSGVDEINAVKLGPQGWLYVTGTTDTSQFTAVGNAFRTTNKGLVDVFVAVLDTTDTGQYGLVYLSYLGGTNNETSTAIDVDGLGFMYVTGSTNSTDFPMVNAFQGTGAASTMDAFIAKFDPNAGDVNGLVFSSYLGGTTGDDVANGMSVSANGIVYLIGTTKSSDFPVSGSAFQGVIWGPSDTFLAKIDSNAYGVAYSTYMGGEGNDDGRKILLAPNGLVYFASSTLSTLFPMAAFNYHGASFGFQDVIIGAMDMNKSGADSLLYSTYFGGSSNEEIRGMALDAKGNLIITGYTLSSDFPVTRDALQATYGGNSDAFVSVVNPTILGPAFLIYSTFLGGAHGEVGYGVAGDSAGNIYVTGYTLSSDFPVVDALQSTWGQGTDLFLTKFKPGVAGRSAIQYSTYLGGAGLYVPLDMTVGPNGNAYVVGYGRIGLPSQGGYAGGVSDGFILAVGQ